MARNVKLVAFLTLSALVALGGSSKLNVATILLPLFDDFPTNFTLQSTDNGCFRWSTSTENVISLNPVGVDSSSDCSSKVTVSTITKDKRRTVTDVLAEDVNTRQLLRCVVIVDVIESLSITTTTRELILEEAPEVFEVRAFDNQGNEFSTLAGVPFDWFITPLGPNKDLPVIRFISFKDSTYETPPTLLDLEETDKRGHKVLLEGVKTGIAKVSVRLAQREYTNVKSNEIQLMIIANLMIIPREVYMMVGDVVTFKILHTSYGHSEEINLKQSQYYLEAEDKNIVTSTKYSAEVRGAHEGETKISLLDRNIDNTETGVRLPFATIYVVKPAYLVLSLLPHNNWAALVSEEHTIVAEVYSDDDHKITLGPDVSVQTRVGERFYVQEKSKNGTWTMGWTQQEGTAEVTAVLDQISPALSARNEITIYPRIILIPSEVILPWDPVVKPKYDLEILATGGDGKFLWSSSNHAVGVVTQNGKVHTHSHGYFEVSAAMHRNHHNRQTAKFHILPPSRLEIAEFVMEAEVGTVIFLHVALYAEKESDGEESSKSYIPFTRCQDLAFKVKTSDPKIAYNKQLTTEPIGIACGSVAVFSQDVGSSKVTVSYQGQSGKILTDSVTVTYFRPLKLVQPVEPIVLGVGTSSNLIFTGGPKSGNAHSKYLVSKEPDVLRAIETTEFHKMPSDYEYTVVNVVCTKLGKSEIVLTASNAPSIPNCKNQESSITVEVICGKPRKIEMYPELKVADAKSCPMDLSADRVVVQSQKDIDLIVRVKDDQGRQFMNITSFQLVWGLEPKGYSQIINQNSVFEREERIGTAVYASLPYQKLKSRIEAGQLRVSVGIVGYLKNVLNNNKVTAEWPEFLDEDEKGVELPPINATITLYMVNDTKVVPNVISIYNHPANKQLLDVKQGSGYYQIALSNDEVADVKYNEKSRQLDIQPRSDGELTIKLIDLCLVSKPAVIVVNVVSVHILRVEMSDRVELSKCISCVVRLYDESDNLLTVPNLDLIEIDSVFEKEIARIEKMDKISSDSNINSNELHYVVTGVELGDTKLAFSIGDPDSEHYVSSAPVDLQVFPPLRLFPRNVTVIVGSQMQYNSRGGPQPIPNLEFSVVDGDIAKISHNGIIKGASVGQTRVKARALGTNPTNGQKIVYTEDQVDVRVIKLTNIKLAAPLIRFQVGATVPLWATGVPDHISPLILATVEPSIHFSWDVDNANVVKLFGVLDSTGIEQDPFDMLSVRLKGLAAGTATVTLNATVYKNNNKKGAVYSSSVQVEIFEKLALIGKSLTSMGNPILMAPYSQFKLQTNMDEYGEMTYKLLGESVSPTTQVQKKVQSTPATPITVSADGVVQSYGLIGTSLVMIAFVDTRGLRQTLTVPIEVKPIHYMLLSFHSTWYVEPKQGVSLIPAGADFEMRASYFDNTGNEFHAGIVELQALTSRFDLIKIRRGTDNSSFHVTARRPGVTALKVWSDSVEKTADYFKLHVGQAIEPSLESVITGDVICFSTPIRRKNVEGAWSSTDPSVMTVDRTHGVAVAVGQRGGQASVQHNFLPSAPAQIKVNQISEIIVQVDSKKPITNAPNGNHKLFVLLRGSDTKIKTNLHGGKKCKAQSKEVDIPMVITCNLAFADTSVNIPIEEVLTVAAKFDFNEGKYYCEINPRTDASGGVDFSTMCSDLLLTVSTPTIMSKETRVKFLPALNIPLEVIIDNTNEGMLVITGVPNVLKNVEVTPVDKTMVCVSNRHIENSSLMFTVKLLDYHKNFDEMKSMSIRVVSKETEQDVLVVVKAKDPLNVIKECPADSSSLLSVIHTHQYIFATIVAIVTIFMISCFVYSSYIQPMMLNASVMRNRSTMGCICASNSSFNASSLSNSSMMEREVSCYCTKSPEVRRNRRYM